MFLINLFLYIISDDIPESFDSRVKWPNCVSKVYNQGSCGACYAFSVATAFSMRYCIRNNLSEIINFSAQNLVDCLGGCQGEYPTDTWNYLNKSGITTEKCLSYKRTQGKCESKCDSNNVKFNRYYAGESKILDSEIEIKKEILKNGPVTSAMNLYGDYYTYQSGIYIHDSNNNNLIGLHSIVILGWGVKDNIKYWLIQDSYGESRGEKGFFKVKIGDDCGVGAMGFCDQIEGKFNDYDGKDNITDINEEKTDKNREDKTEEKTDKKSEDKTEEKTDKKSEDKTEENDDKKSEDKKEEKTDKKNENKNNENTNNKSIDKTEEKTDKNSEDKINENANNKSEDKNNEIANNKSEDKNGEKTDKKKEDKNNENSNNMNENKNNENSNNMNEDKNEEKTDKKSEDKNNENSNNMIEDKNDENNKSNNKNNENANKKSEDKKEENNNSMNEDINEENDDPDNEDEIIKINFNKGNRICIFIEIKYLLIFIFISFLLF